MRSGIHHIVSVATHVSYNVQIDVEYDWQSYEKLSTQGMVNGSARALDLSVRPGARNSTRLC